MLKDAPVSAILPSTDLARSKDFYQNKLGLGIAYETTEGGGGFVMFEAGKGTKIALYEKPEGTKAEHTVAGFDVDDLGKAMSELEAKGVTFEEYDLPNVKTTDKVMEYEGARTAWLKDPDGNILAINEMTKQ